MRRLENAVSGVGDKLRLRAGIGAPEYERNRVRGVIELSDYLIGEYLPALAAVRVCLSPAYRERCVQQQYTLLCPAGQIAAL